MPYEHLALGNNLQLNSNSSKYYNWSMPEYLLSVEH